MPRKKREWYEGACYHIMGRGNRHSVIFRDGEDFRLFLKILQSVKERYPFTLHAYCLMTNHFHLELSTIDVPIWEIMQPMMSCYARLHNKKHGLDGHLFDSRYTSCLIRNDAYFLEVSRYIHLNPVKAGMVTDPLEYEHSSYRLYVTGVSKLKEIMDTSRVLSYFTDDPHEKYRMFVGEKIAHEEEERSIQKDIREDDFWMPI